LSVIDAGKCVGTPPPGETVLQNGDSQQKAFCIWNAFCCGVAILEHGLPWRRLTETLSRVNYKQILRVFLTIVYREIVGSLVTAL
jgi:hypothetical protein